MRRVRLHVLADGRDVPDNTALPWIERLQADVDALNAGGRPGGCDVRIASGGGRMVTTMDRYESDWNIVKRGYEAHVLGAAPHFFPDAVTAVKTLKVGAGAGRGRMGGRGRDGRAGGRCSACRGIELQQRATCVID